MNTSALKKIIVVLIALLVYSNSIICDTIYLKNGKSYKGHIFSQTKDSVNFRTGKKILTFKKKKIDRIVFQSASEKRKAEAKRKAKLKRKKEARRIAEKKKKDEARRILEKKREAQAKRIAEEKQKKEIKRIIEIEQKAKADRKKAESKQKAREKREAEVKQIAKEKKKNDAKKLEKLKRIAEANRLAKQRRDAEAKRKEKSKAKTKKWMVGYGIGVGIDDSQLEPREAQDRLFASLYLNGFSLSEPWQDKQSSSSYLELTYFWKKWEFLFDYFIAESLPRWTRGMSADFSINKTNIIQSLKLKPLERENLEIMSAYKFIEESNQKLLFRSGLKYTSSNADYEAYDYSSIVFIQNGNEINGSQAGLALEKKYSTEATGLQFGFEYRYLAKDFILYAGLDLYSLYGQIQGNEINLRSLVVRDTNIQNAFWLEEKGELTVEGQKVRLGYIYKYSQNIDFLCEIFREESTYTDSKVEYIRLDTSEGFGAKNILQYFFNYPGTSQNDDFRGINFKVRYRF